MTSNRELCQSDQQTGSTSYKKAKLHKIFHLNIQCVRNKIEQLELSLAEILPDFVCLCEHWLSKDEIQTLKLENYYLGSSFCRVNYIHGGVGIYVRPVFTSDEVLEINNLSVEKTFECCSVRCKPLNCIVVSLYRTPDSNFELFINKLEDLFTILSNKYQKYEFYICADFNINFLNGADVRVKKFINLLSCFNLKTIIQKPTRVTKVSETLIDNIITQQNNSIVNAQCQDLMLSDHFALLLEFNASSNLPKSFGKTFTSSRSYSAESLSELDYMLRNEDWRALLESCDTNDSYEIFHTYLSYYFNVVFPKKRRKIRSGVLNTNWITSDVKNLSKLKRELYLVLRRLDSSNADVFELKMQYKAVCSNIKKMVINSKREHNTALVSNATNKSSTIWKIINKNNPAQCQLNSNFPQRFKIGNENVKDFQTVSNAFNDLYVNVSKNLDLIEPKKSVDFGYPNTLHSLFLGPCNEVELLNTIMSLKNTTSTGWDEIPVKILKKVAIHLTLPLCHVINLSFQQGVFPDLLKTAIVKPIYKKGDREQMENYRPISLLSNVSKVFERVIYTRLITYLNRHEIIHRNQHGFRAGFSTNLALFRLVEEFIGAWNGRSANLLALFDLSKAFDCVHHDLLCSKLSTMGVRGVALNLIQSYLHKRKQTVQLSTMAEGEHRVVNSQTKEIYIGVPQGSILGPLLFILYINDLIRIEDRALLFADDVGIPFVEETENDLSSVVEDSLTKVKSWFVENGLKLNIDKTQYVTFGGYGDVASTLNLSGTGSIEFTEAVKFLGIHIDKDLSWGGHIESVISKINKYGYLIRNLRKTVPIEILLNIYYAYIESSLRYGIIIWGVSNLMPKLFIAQKRCIRSIVGAGRQTPCRPIFNELKILTLYDLYVLESVMFFAKHKNLFTDHQTRHFYNTRFKDKLKTHQSNLTKTLNSPYNSIIRLYNKIPNWLKNQTKLHILKKNLKKYLLSLNLYSISEL